MTEKYIMTRHSPGNSIYTFEFIVVLSFFIISILFWKFKNDKNSLFVYIISGLWNSFIELSANIFGVRTIDKTLLFGVIEIGFPFLQLIMGFYEGGVQCLVAYHLINVVMKRENSSLVFALGYLLITNFFIGMSQFSILDTSTSSVGITRRDIFSLGSILLLFVCFIVSFGYFFLNKSITIAEKKSFLLWYLFIMLVYFPIFLISQISMYRFIEIEQNGNYITAPLFAQILILYGYGLGFEAAGFFLPIYVILHRLDLTDFGD